MNPRVEFLTAKLKGYLERRTMPRGLADKPKAQEAELSALIHCLTRYAPREEFGEWWVKMESGLAENSETRAWPTEGEIRKAAANIRGPQTRQISEGDEIDPLQINADRMNSGAHVGDGCLYGRVAVDMMAPGAGHSRHPAQVPVQPVFQSQENLRRGSGSGNGGRAYQAPR